MTKKAVKKHPGGRPTLYKKEYCEKLIKHMAKGFSFESFAGLMRVSKQTIYEWLDKHKEFSDAKKEAMELNRLFWEQKGVQGLYSEARKPFNSTVWLFNMKNRFPREWRDKHEVEQSGNVGIVWKEEKTYEAEQKTDEST